MAMTFALLFSVFLAERGVAKEYTFLAFNDDAKWHLSSRFVVERKCIDFIYLLDGMHSSIAISNSLESYLRS